MKNSTLLLLSTGILFLFYTGEIKAQGTPTSKISFSYDASGNRIRRELIVITDGGDIGSPLRPSGQKDTLRFTESHFSASVYPNPAGEFIDLQINSSSDQLQSKALLYDLSGKLLTERSINSAGMHTFDLSALASGVYVLKLQSGREEKQWQILKK